MQVRLIKELITKNTEATSQMTLMEDVHTPYPAFEVRCKLLGMEMAWFMLQRVLL